MSAQTQKLHRGEGMQKLTGRGRALRHVLFAALLAAACVVETATWRGEPASAQQFIPCPPEQSALLQIPELAAVGNILRGTIVLSDEQQAIPFRYPPQSKPGDPDSVIRCQPQYVRTLRGVGATPAQPASTGQFPNPMPGPTLRARVGDIINITFLNQINPAHFGRSIDNGETGVGCDQPVPPGDVFPDCFHGSSTGNIHFHGTHTNPDNTGDNVFIEVRPLPRDNQGNLTTSPQKVQEDLDKFYAQCTERLKVSPLIKWPRVWSDMPSDWTGRQQDLLQAYDNKLKEVYGIPPAKALWPTNKKLIDGHHWPQYYVGVFPYCFRLPEYKDTGWPPAAPPAAHAAHPMGTGMGTRGGAGTAELNAKGTTAPEQLGVSPSLIMGQSPGTHWYHAHKHGSTAINVANGMTGVFIIEGGYDDALNAFYGPNWTRTQPVMVLNQLGVTPNLLRGGQGGQGGMGATDKGPNISVNGQMNPVIKMQPGEVKMWRVVNTSGRAGAYFNVPHKNAAGQYDQFEWRQIAQDGVQFNYYNYETRQGRPFLLASGNRTDLLVQAKPCPNNLKTCDYPVQVQIQVDPSDLKSALPATIMTIRVEGDPVSPTTPAGQFIPKDKYPQLPPFLKDIANSEVKGSRTVTFASTSPNLPAGPGTGPPAAAQHTIDGKKFSAEVGELVKLNTVEEWKIVNASYGPPISHPFHIHINPFQVTEIFEPNASVTVTYTDPKTKRPVIDPKTKQPITATVSQYVFDTNSLFTSKQYPTFQAQVRSKQCLLNPQAPDSWHPCEKAPPNVNNIWWDVFPIPSGKRATDAQGNPIKDAQGIQVAVPGYFKMRSRFVDYAGFFVIHCHILAHEDRGMMTIVEVSPAPMPYSHN
jgi:FtsP/CotA-like multicopper oxidase with cupredoxin domain